MFSRLNEKLQKLRRLEHERARRRMRSIRGDFYSLLWQSAAEDCHVSYERAGPNKHIISNAETSFEFVGARVSLDTPEKAENIGDKAELYQVYKSVGVAPPSYAVFSSKDLNGAVNYLQRQPNPCVVKPARETGGGEGVTMGVRSPARLKRALKYAKTYCAEVIIEPEIPGDVFRLLYLDGILLDIVQRDAPQIVGDGGSSIRALIKAENDSRMFAQPFTALSLLTFDADMANMLELVGLNENSILKRGETIRIKGACNQNSKYQNHRVRGALHSETECSIQSLIAHFGVRLVGVDIICRDLTARMSPENGFICELNTFPGLHHHFLTTDDSDPTHIPKKILTALFDGDD